MENLQILSFIFTPRALSGPLSRVSVSAFRRNVPFRCLLLLQDLSLTVCQKLKLFLGINVPFQGRLCSWHPSCLQFIHTRLYIFPATRNCFIAPQSVPSDLEEN